MGSQDILNAIGAFGRRGFLRGHGCCVLAGLAYARPDWPRQSRCVVLNFASYGGVLNDYMTRLFAVAFREETGIRVNFGGNASLALAKMQTTSGAAAQWDLIKPDRRRIFAAVEDNIIAPYDYSIIDASHIAPEYKGTHGIKFRAVLVRHGL